MKKFKYLLSVLVLALVLTCAFGTAKVKAAEEEPVVPASEVQYNDQTIVITSESQVYYQVVKTDEKDVKGKSLIPVAKTGVNEYKIDFSAITKATTIVWTTTTGDYDQDAAETYHVVKLTAPIKGIKFSFDCTVEVPETFWDAIYTFDVTPVEGDAVKYDKSAKDANPAAVKSFNIQWKRGADGAWNPADAADFKAAYSMLRASNGTVYVRVISKTTDDTTTEFLPSKEAKVKVSKTPAAPTVKVDYVKGTVAIKSGMQVKFNDAVYYVPVKVADSKATDKLVVLDPEAAVVGVAKAISAIDIATLVAKLEVEDGAEFTIEVRNAGTAKKFPSYWTKLTLTAPAAAPDAETSGFTSEISADGKKYTLKGKDGFEYAIVASDATDFADVKFTALTTTGKAVAVESGKKVVVRKAGVKPTTTAAGVFPSKADAVTLAVAKVKVTFSVVDAEGEDNEGAKTGVSVKDATGAAALASAYEAVKDSELVFTVAGLDGGKTAVVKAGETPLVANEDGQYTIAKVSADVTVTITVSNPTE